MMQHPPGSRLGIPHTVHVHKILFTNQPEVMFVCRVLAGMFRKIQTYMGDVAADETPENPGDERTLQDILMCGRRNIHLACELYCQLIKQTHRCMNAENEVRRKEDVVMFGYVDLNLTSTRVRFPSGQNGFGGSTLTCGGHIRGGQAASSERFVVIYYSLILCTLADASGKPLKCFSTHL